MAIYIYRSTDTSAPILDGATNSCSFVNLLKACLVDGYGDKTAIGQTLDASTPGCMVFKMPSGTSECSLVVDDTGSGAAGNVSRLRGYVDASVASVAETSGIRPFPTDIQMSGGARFYHSDTVSSTQRAWILFSDGTIFYVWADVGSLGGGANGRTICFGDLNTYSTKDTKACFLCGTASDNYGYFPISNSNLQYLGDHWLCAKFNQLSWSMYAGKVPINGLHLNAANASMMGQQSAFLSTPEVISGGYQLTPFAINELHHVTNVPTLRGHLPGIQAPIHGLPFTTGDVISGASGTALEGRTFEAVRTQTYWSGSGKYGCYLFETSDTQRDVAFV